MSLDPIIQNKNDIPSDLSQHAREVEALWTDYSHNENKRVPITFACDEQVWLKVSGHTFREFYTIPEVHLEAQLEVSCFFDNRLSKKQK